MQWLPGARRRQARLPRFVPDLLGVDSSEQKKGLLAFFCVHNISFYFFDSQVVPNVLLSKLINDFTQGAEMLKKVFIAIVGLAVVAVVGVWVAVAYFLDSATIAEGLKKEAATRLNRELNFDGQIGIKVFPKVQIVLPATTLSFEGRQEPQFTLQGAEVGVAVLPLLTGDVQFDAVRINGLKGEVNAARFIDQSRQSQVQEATTEEKTAEASGGFIKNLEVASVEIVDSSLTVYGLQDKKIYSVSQLNLTTGQLGLSGSTNVDLSTNFEEKTQPIQGHLDFKGVADYDIKSMKVLLRDVQSSVTVKQDGTNLAATINVDSLSSRDAAFAAHGLKLNVKLNDTMQANATVKSASYSAEGAVSLDDVTLAVKQAGGVSASATLGLTGSVAPLSLKTKALKGEAQIAVNNAVTKIPFSGEASMAEPEKIVLSLNGKLDNETFAIALQAAGFSKPMVTGSVRLNSINVSKWVATPSQKKTAENTFRVIQDAVASGLEHIKALDAFNSNVNVAINKVQYEQLTISNVGTNIRVNNGTLNLNNVKAQLCSGNISASVALTAAQRWNANLNASAIRTECVLEGLGQKPMLTGALVASAKLNGTGIDELALKKASAGNMAIKVNNAVLRGISLEKVAKVVRDGRQSAVNFGENDTTSFSSMSGNATLRDGVLSVTSLQATSSLAQIKGGVNLGLMDNSIGGTVSAVLATSKDGRRVTVPIKLSGTLDAPQYGVDVAEAIKANAQEAVMEATKRVIKDEKAQKLIEGLGSLLKR